MEPRHASTPQEITRASQHSAEEHWSGDDSSAEEHELGQSAPSKRKRPLSVSCETCKARKVKCDRGAPSCGWCLKNNAQCTYLPRKKPGLRAGYGRELEARLDKLESLLVQQQSQINQLTSAQSIASGTSPQAEASFRSPTIVQTPYIPRPETALFLQKPPATFSSQTAVRSQFSNGIGSDRPTPAVPANVFNNIQNYAGVLPPNQVDADLPPYDLLYSLVDLFFKHVYPCCPILHRQSTLNSLFGDASLDEDDRILLHALVATTLKFSTDQRLTAEKRERYHRISKQKVLLHSIDNSSVKSLQALVILSLDIFGGSNGPPAWNILALMTRSVVQLGLAVESYSPAVAPQFASIYTLRAIILTEPKDWIEDESRRRLMWMIFVMDRYATVATAFEFALDEKEIDRRLPCAEDSFLQNVPVRTRWFQTSTRTENDLGMDDMGAFSFYVEILGILTQIHKFLKRPIDITSISDVEIWQNEYRKLDRALEQWKYNLPQEFGNLAKIISKPGSSLSMNIMLHAAFYTTVIRLHSSAAYPTYRSPIFTPSFNATQRCLGAVENIATLCTYVRESGMLAKLGPPFAFSLWVAARVLIVHGSTIGHQVDPSINLLVSSLHELGQYWEVSKRYANLLSRVLSEYQESQEVPSVTGERVTPSTVKILADMRRCAFDLDFLISRQPKPSSDLAAIPAAPRPPAANELEYLDIFDFFNMPRLPVSMDAASSSENVQLMDDKYGNITNYIVDANSDWL